MPHLHPFLTHFPIVLLLVGAVAAILSRRDARLVDVSFWAWLGGAVIGILATATGLIDHEPYEATGAHELVEQHQFLGIGTTLLAVALAAWRWVGRRRGADPVPGAGVALGFGVIVAVLCLAAGYTGGQLVLEHGVGVKEITWPLSE